MMNPSDSGQPEAVKPYSPAGEIWKRFRQIPGGMAGLFMIVFLFLCAMFAPLLANDQPLAARIGGKWCFPVLLQLFAPDSTEVIVEKVFNYLLLSLPLSGVALVLLQKKWKRKMVLVVYILLCSALVIPFFCVRKSHENARKDWRTLASASQKTKDLVILAPVPYSPYESAALPYEKWSCKHWFGTDHSGRDVFARMVYGARVSLAVGVAATVLSIMLGSVIGMIAGYCGGKLDLLIMRIVEIVICFPTFLLLLILMAILLDHGSRQSILLVIAVFGLTSWTTLCRLVRGETLKIRESAYIQSCESLGCPVWRTLLFHVLPNVSGPVFVSFTFEVAGAILAESSLSFLGFGVQDPTSSWGELLRQAFPDPLSYYHLMLLPGAAIFLAVCAFNLTGEGLRKALSGKEINQ